MDDVGGVEFVDVLGYGRTGKAIGVSRFWVLAGQQELNDEESKKSRKVEKSKSDHTTRSLGVWVEDGNCN